MFSVVFIVYVEFVYEDDVVKNEFCILILYLDCDLDWMCLMYFDLGNF